MLASHATVGFAVRAKGYKANQNGPYISVQSGVNSYKLASYTNLVYYTGVSVSCVG